MEYTINLDYCEVAYTWEYYCTEAMRAAISMLVKRHNTEHLVRVPRPIMRLIVETIHFRFENQNKKKIHK
jgi:hypothetical protein